MMLIYSKFHSSAIHGAPSVEIVYIFFEQPVHVHIWNSVLISAEFSSYIHITPWGRRGRLRPQHPLACRKRRLNGVACLPVGCDPCRLRKGSWWLRARVDHDVFPVQHSTLASTCARREVECGSIQSIS